MILLKSLSVNCSCSLSDFLSGGFDFMEFFRDYCYKFPSKDIYINVFMLNELPHFIVFRPRSNHLEGVLYCFANSRSRKPFSIKYYGPKGLIACISDYLNKKVGT